MSVKVKVHRVALVCYVIKICVTFFASKCKFQFSVGFFFFFLNYLLTKNIIVDFKSINPEQLPNNLFNVNILSCCLSRNVFKKVSHIVYKNKYTQERI